MNSASIAWVCCQLGAREHYVVPRALHRTGDLSEVITDVWMTPALRAFTPSRMRERFHAELSDETVSSSNLSAVWFEARHWLAGSHGWDLILERNDWFQQRALQQLNRLARRMPGRQYRVFAFSYAARRLFAFAKSRNWATVLGQIDPGPPEEHIVARLHRQHAALAQSWQPAPPRYWDEWREECALADRIVVNSAWSHRALCEEGIPECKLSVVPLAHDAPAAAAEFRRSYPGAFTFERPMRVLFLGQINLRKGVSAILEAMAQLRHAPIEFWFVGPRQMNVPAECLGDRQARWLGNVPRGETARYYKEADLFLFPTFSDGFGLTQLEAQAWRLPIIASRFCGSVVRDGANGMLLDEISGAAIAEVLRSLLADPGRLESMSRDAATQADFGIDRFGKGLRQVFDGRQ